jgi:hypothetical protein
MLRKRVYEFGSGKGQKSRIFLTEGREKDKGFSITLHVIVFVLLRT